MQTGNGTGLAREEGVEANVKPLLAIVPVTGTTDVALRLMNEAGTDFAAVVDGAGAFAGVVLRGGVERGCKGMGHQPSACAVINHLKRDARRHWAGDELDWRVRAFAVREPVVVVSSTGVPVGVLDLAG